MLLDRWTDEDVERFRNSSSETRLIASAFFLTHVDRARADFCISAIWKGEGTLLDDEKLTAADHRPREEEEEEEMPIDSPEVHESIFH